MVVTKLSDKQGVGDLTADGKSDVAVVLTQNSGGSGTFYYAAALLNNGTPQGQATNSVLLGDRIVLQNVAVTNGQMVVNYLDRRSGEPMTTAPSVAVTKTFAVRDGQLVPANTQ